MSETQTIITFTLNEIDSMHEFCNYVHYYAKGNALVDMFAEMLSISRKQLKIRVALCDLSNEMKSVVRSESAARTIVADAFSSVANVLTHLDDIDCYDATFAHDIANMLFTQLHAQLEDNEI
jgi:hypothetical protein